MKKYCYGRFNVIHKGHEKLFAASDVVIVSRCSSERLAEIQALWPEHKFITTSGSIFAEFAEVSSPFTLVLGEDNKALGQKLEALGRVVEYLPLEEDALNAALLRETYSFDPRTDFVAADFCSNEARAQFTKDSIAEGL